MSVHERVSYAFAGRECNPYTKAKLEMTNDEVAKLTECLQLSTAHSNDKDTQESFLHTGRHKVIFDTDLGSDIDDALALLALLHLDQDDVEVLGITTVYACTRLRTKVCELLVRTENPIPVVSGESHPLGSARPLWMTGTEGWTSEPILTSEEISELLQESVNSHNYEAAEFIVEQACGLGFLKLICEGAATNIALALELCPEIAPDIQHIVYMAMGKRMDHRVLAKWEKEYFPIPTQTEPITPGKVFSFYPGHNISTDTWAFKRVFDCPNLKISVVNDTVTNECWWEGAATQELIQLGKTGTGEMRIGGLLLSEWLEYRTAIFNTPVKGTCPHDALTVMEAVYPGKFVEYKRGWLVAHEWAGYTSFVCDPTGPHRIGIAMKDAKEFLEFISTKILRED